MSTLGNALPSNRTALENALLRIEDEARVIVYGDPGHNHDSLHAALTALDELRDAIRKGERT